MPIPRRERQKMLAVRLCRPRVIARLESIGIAKLGNLADRDPYQLVPESEPRRRPTHLAPPMATQAMTNLITAAQQRKGW